MKRLPSRGSEQFNLRLPDGMRERIAREAAENGRSMNSEIVAALSDCYPELPSISLIVKGMEGAVKQLEDRPDDQAAVLSLVVRLVELSSRVQENAEVVDVSEPIEKAPTTKRKRTDKKPKPE